MCWRGSVLLVSALFLAGALGAASGNPTLMSVRAFVVVQDSDRSPSVLNQLDLMTGELTAVGDIGFQVTALAFSTTGELYGIDSELDVLVRIETSQGGGVEVGRLGFDVVDLLGSDLTFDGEDNLWMMATVGDARGLYRIDQHSGYA